MKRNTGVVSLNNFQIQIRMNSGLLAHYTVDNEYPLTLLIAPNTTCYELLLLNLHVINIH